MTIRAIVGGAAAVVAFAIGSAAVAQAPASAEIGTAQSDEYGAYLVDGEGMALYLFTRDTQGTDGTAAVSACTGGCLQAWPRVTTTDMPTASGDADAALLGTIEVDGVMQVTYNGWPLYYYAMDMMPGDTTGQERGGVWFLLTPAGEQIGGEAAAAPAGGG